VAVHAGGLVRIVAVEGAQVCDLNLWNLNNHASGSGPHERASCKGPRDDLRRLWSCLPYLRPMVTITNDTFRPSPLPAAAAA